jgi:hypothetical protein
MALRDISMSARTLLASRGPEDRCDARVRSCPVLNSAAVRVPLLHWLHESQRFIDPMLEVRRTPGVPHVQCASPRHRRWPHPEWAGGSAQDMSRHRVYVLESTVDSVIEASGAGRPMLRRSTSAGGPFRSWNGARRTSVPKARTRIQCERSHLPFRAIYGMLALASPPAAMPFSGRGGRCRATPRGSARPLLSAAQPTPDPPAR